MRLYPLHIIFVLIFYANSFEANAQTSLSKLDSLQHALGSAKGDERYEVLYELFNLWKASDFPKALSYAEDYKEQATSQGDSVKMVIGGRMVAYSFMNLGRNEEAARALTYSLGIANRNLVNHPELKLHKKFLLNNAGVSHMLLGQYDKALKYHFESLVIREEEGDQQGIRNATNNIGLVFYNLRDFDRAIQYYLKAVDLSREIGDESNIELIYVNLGLSYMELDNADEAMKWFNKALDRCDGACNDVVMKGLWCGLGQSYLANKDYAKAKEFLKKSLVNSRKQNDQLYIAENLTFLSQAEFGEKNEIEAINYLKEAQKYAEASNNVKLKLIIYKDFASHLANKKLFEESASYLNKYISLKDSVFTEQVAKNMATVQTDYAERENLKTIAEKDQVLLLKEEIISRQQRQNVFIVLIAVLVLALAGVSLYFSRRQQRINSELSGAKSKIEEQNLQLSGYNKELEVKVEERTKDLNLSNQSLKKVNAELDNFIYKTSHDIRGPLATLRGMCNLAMVDVKDEMALSYLKKMDFTADRLNTILTRLSIVNHINNSSLAPTAILFRDIIEEIILAEKKKGIPDRFKIDYTVDHGVILVSDRDLVKLVLENLVDNAIKFYNNSDRIDPFVKITISKGDQLVKIFVEDNGIGIQNKAADEVFQMFMRASERSESGGIGLYLAKLTTEKLGGVISLESTNDHGSKFLVLLPEDISLVLDSKSNNSQVLRNKLMAMRLQGKSLPSLFG